MFPSEKQEPRKPRKPRNLENQENQEKQKNTAKKKLDKISTQSGSVINVSNLKIKRSASKIQVSFQINNQTKQRQLSINELKQLVSFRRLFVCEYL